LFDLLTSFKAITGYGLLCNTSLNFKGKGFITQCPTFPPTPCSVKLDGFVVEGRIYMLKSSLRYQQYLRSDKSLLAKA